MMQIINITLERNFIKKKEKQKKKILLKNEENNNENNQNRILIKLLLKENINFLDNFNNFPFN